MGEAPALGAPLPPAYGDCAVYAEDEGAAATAAGTEAPIGRRAYTMLRLDSPPAPPPRP